MILTSSTRGAAAEQHVVAQALRHGLRVAVPVVDLDGVDLYISNSRGELAAVQVKIAQRHKGGWRLRVTTSGTRRRYTAVDAFVAVSPDFTKVWIVPAAPLVALRYNVTLRSKWLDRWSVFEAVGAFRGRAA